MTEYIYKIEKNTFKTYYILKEKFDNKFDENYRFLKIIQEGNSASSEFIDTQKPMNLSDSKMFVKLEIKFMYPNKKHEVIFFFIDNSFGSVKEITTKYIGEFNFQNGFQNLIKQALENK
jgi:hypothetical protein